MKDPTATAADVEAIRRVVSSTDPSTKSSAITEHALPLLQATLEDLGADWAKGDAKAVKQHVTNLRLVARTVEIVIQAQLWRNL